MKDHSRCLVFGGSGALGQVLCEMLACRGVRLAFTYNSGESVARKLVERLPELIPFHVDATSVPEIENVVNKAAVALGGLDAFINCSAIVKPSGTSSSTVRTQRMQDVSLEDWDATIAVNVRSSFFACRRVSEVLAENGGGNLVLVGSVDAVKLVPSPVHLSASQAALYGMTRAMAKELGSRNIRVNLVASGILDGGKSLQIPQELHDLYKKHCGFKRVGKLTELASVIAWLAIENTYVNGQAIVVDGAL
jgi:3-oxoacyl-[acyl-carrier protein] reductase